MTWLQGLVLAVQMISAVAIIVLVLLQQGKGADAGAAFGGGGGAAGSVFGSAGSSNFLSRATGWLAAVFFVCTLGLAYLGSESVRAPAAAPAGGILDAIPGQTSTPASPGSEIPSQAPPPASSGGSGASSIPGQ